MDFTQEFFTPTEIAEMTGVKVLTVYRWIKEGKLKATKLGQWRISREDLQNALGVRINNYPFQKETFEDDNIIKANLPSSAAEYRVGAGEGCFFLVSDEVKKAYDTDEKGTTYQGILDNDSYYFKGLLHGETLPLEMRGDKRPVVPYTWLIEHFQINREFFK